VVTELTCQRVPGQLRLCWHGPRTALWNSHLQGSDDKRGQWPAHSCFAGEAGLRILRDGCAKWANIPGLSRLESAIPGKPGALAHRARIGGPAICQTGKGTFNGICHTPPASSKRRL